MAGALAAVILQGALLALQIAPVDSDAPLPPAAGGYGVQLVRSALALAGVCVAAWLLLRWAAQRGMGQGPRGRHVRVLERVMLEPRRGLYLVEVGARVMLLGSAEGGLSLLAELKPEDLAAGQGPTPAARGPGFAELIARVRRAGAAPAGFDAPASAPTASVRNPEHPTETENATSEPPPA